MSEPSFGMGALLTKNSNCSKCHNSTAIWGAPSTEVPSGCTKTSAIKCETDEVLFKIDLWELALQKLDEIPVPSSSTDDNMGNINIGETKEDCLDGEKGSSGTKCCLHKIALLWSANIWVGDLWVFVHCMNDRHGGSNIHKDSSTGIVCAYGKAMTADSIMDIAGTWYKK